MKYAGQRKTNIIQYHLYVESKKNDTTELITFLIKSEHALWQSLAIEEKLL